MPRDPFLPALDRPSSVVVARNRARNQWRLVLTTPASPQTEVVVIDDASGLLLCQPGPGFPSELAALSSLHALGYEAEHRGDALLGYVATRCVAGVLLATRTREKGVLPGGHALLTLTESAWLLLPLSQAGPGGLEVASPAEQEFWRLLQQVTLDGAHYFCWTADLSRPFPSPRPAADPAPEFVWNRWLSAPLARAGLPGRCPVLLQGAAEVSLHAGVGAAPPFALALVSRRSRRHPGTRYLARGLNEAAGPGNEIECELVAWTLARGAAGGRAGVRWACCVWRRGTVPIWWGVSLASLQKGLAAEVYVRERDPYRGSAAYFRGVQRAWARYEAGQTAAGAGGSVRAGQAVAEEGSASGMQAAGGQGGGGATPANPAASEDAAEEGLHVPVTCVNLLHCNPAKASELMLSSHFQESMRHVRRILPPGAPIRVVNFDWHGNIGRLGEEKGVEGFWSFMEPFVKQTGFSHGTLHDGGAVGEGRERDGITTSLGPARRTPWAGGWVAEWEARQAGVLRYNCADSLDRTNAATCFATLPVLQDALRTLGVDLCVGPGRDAGGAARSGVEEGGAVRPDAGALGSLPPPLVAGRPASTEQVPPGWEVRWHGGRPLYVDHANRRTQWEAPSRPEEPDARPAQAASGPAAAPDPGTGGSPARVEVPPPGATAVALAQLSLRQGREDGAPDPAPRPGPAPREDSGHVRPGAGPLGSPGPTPPQGPQPWAFFGLRGMAEVRARLRRPVVADFVEAFRVHGDINSFLYTGSPAMHSHVLGLVLQNSSRTYSAASGVGKLQNIRVALQRRWNNTVSDGARQQALELFLGVKLDSSCPGLDLVYGPEEWAEPELRDPEGPTVDGAGPGAGPAPAGDAEAAALPPPPFPHHADLASLASPGQAPPARQGPALGADGTAGDPLGASPGATLVTNGVTAPSDAQAQQAAAELDLLL
uniref:Phosphoinositide phosphatase SAC9 n=2 Tax=Auxenochlorella protothecoides TaxID=3075 RepID=A0A1D2A0P7_AUXPR